MPHPAHFSRIDPRISILTLFICLALAEAGLWLVRPAIWRALPNAGAVSGELLDDQLAAAQRAGAGKKVLLCLGDSVFFGSALRGAGVPAWRAAAPPAALGRALGPDWSVADLSADGLYPADLEALLGRGLALEPAAVVLQLNIRMLCAPAGVSSTAYSRAWLDAGRGPDLGGRMAQALRGHWLLFRYADLGRDLVWQPGPRELMAGWAATAFPKDEEGADPEALRAMKLRPYYGAPAAGPGHLGRLALERLALRLSQAGAPCLAFLCPQNLAAVDSVLDHGAYEANRRALAAPFKGFKGVRYADWSARKPGAFLDHCHLDAAGNAALSAMILEELR